MHWIETIFHVDPDGGNGFLEAVYYVVVCSLVGIPVGLRIRRRRSR